MRRKDKKTKAPAKPPKPSRLRTWWSGMEPGRRRGVAVMVGWGVLGVLFAVGAVVGMRTVRDRVLRKTYRGLRGQAFVQLADAPQWMPGSLAGEIVAELTPPKANLADRKLAQKVYDRAAANPWVRRVRRVRICPNTGAPGGIVEADLEFRRPAACARYGSDYYYVDAKGCRLPATQVPMWVITLQDRRGRAVRQVSYLSRGEIPPAWRNAAQRIHYIVVDGVTGAPPPPGWQWPGEDLVAALRLIALVAPRPYYPQITLIDVRNHAARITRNEPELRMYAQLGRGRPTDIRFGRFPAPGGGDYVISPQRKISYLDEYVADHAGRLAGVNIYLDLRFDELHVSIN